MKKKLVFLPEDINAVKKIALREEFYEVLSILNSSSDEIIITTREAQVLINLMVFEGYRLTLLYPYDQESHPLFNETHKSIQEDFFYGLYLRFTMAIEQEFDIERRGKKV